MPRIGSRPEEQSTGGSQFEFAEGKGRVIAAVVANHAIPNVTTLCGYKLTIQRLGDDWRPTSEEPQEEFVEAGFVSTFNGDPQFHPGNARSSDDMSPELEIGLSGDMGDADGAEGTCLLTGTGYGPSSEAAKNPAKLSLFTNSCLAHGVKPELFNGFAPNLIGLEAQFTRFMMKKSASDKNVTCLIVGKGGKVAGGEIHKYPAAQGGGAGVSTGGAPVKATPPVRSKANGAAGAVSPGPAAVPPVQAESTGGAAVAVPEDVSLKAGELLRQLQGVNAQTITRARVKNKLVTLFSKNRVPPTMHKQIQDALQDDTWFAQFAEDAEWVVAGDNVTIPAVQPA